MSELKPCPFCGCEGIIKQDNEGRFFAQCRDLLNNCRIADLCQTNRTYDYETTASLWNTRTESALLDRIIQYIEDNAYKLDHTDFIKFITKLKQEG